MNRSGFFSKPERFAGSVCACRDWSQGTLVYNALVSQYIVCNGVAFANLTQPEH